MCGLCLSVVQRAEIALEVVIETVLLLLASVASIIYLMWHTLIIIGLVKDPILWGFQKYGDDEPFYYPFPGMLAASGILMVPLGYITRSFVNIWCLPFGPAAIFFVAAWYVWNQHDFARSHPEIFLSFPRWCKILREYTDREERRRIAYMWLRLPLRTRLLLNSNDRAFLNWADMVIMATML